MFLFALLLSAPAQDAPALPVVPDGFAIDLIAEAPDILWPSAVLCLSDGSLLVAEDPMDMPGPTDQPIDRIWKFRWNEDGSWEKTLFADELWATFGLEEIDGAVYVMNMPELTVLRDRDGDGVAEEREVLIDDLGPPAPGWPGGFNDHIVSGIRLGMDGWLYISVGDKGVPLAHGTDGSEITLRGGGVVRVRPDGTQLQVFASGTRNHLDVAIDENGEIFTYDNTDDGLGWWTRLTHIIPGGYYGYPWDYHDRQDRMLPAMADYGGGSPCGGLFYREAVWPEPYRGSLFYCEWGKGVVRRFELEPEGATFRVALDEDFITGGDVQEFRPLDMCESPDGRFLYIADWGHGGWRVENETGRIWRVRRADDDGRSPGGVIAEPESVEDAIRLLGDAGFRQRLTAQRFLLRNIEPTRAGLREPFFLPLALADVGKLFGSDARMDRAAVHFELLRGALSDSSLPLSVLGGLRDYLPARAGKLQLNPWLEAGGELARLAAHEIEAGQYVTGISGTLVRRLARSDDVFERYAVRRALRSWGEWDVILGALHAADDRTVDELLLVFEEHYDFAAVRALASALSETSAVDLRVRLLRTLASSHREEEPWDGVWWSIQPARTPRPPKTVDWRGTWLVVETVRNALLSRDVELRSAAIECAVEMNDRSLLPEIRASVPAEAALAALVALRDDGCASDLAKLLDHNRSDAARQSAIDTAVAIGSDSMVELLVSAANGRYGVDDDATRRCIEALGLIGAEGGREVAERGIEHENADVRAASCTALGRIAGAEAQPLLEQALADDADGVRAAAIGALGELGTESVVEPLLARFADERDRAGALAALTRVPDARAVDAYLEGLDAPVLALREASLSALRVVRADVREHVEELAAADSLSDMARGVLQKMYLEPEPVLAWHLLGPFELPDPELVLDPNAVDLDAALGDDERQWSWKEVQARAEDGFINLEDEIAPKSNVEAYAFARVSSKTDRTVEARAGSDDMLTVWVNGEQVHDFPGARGWSRSADRFDIALREGENEILLRIGQGGGQWSFNMELPADGTGPLYEQLSRAPTLDDYRETALAGGGSPERGETLFRDSKGLLCMRCHAVRGEGATVGPDLFDVGAKYTREELVRSILEPSQRIAEGYKATQLVMYDAPSLFGRVEQRDALALRFLDTAAVEHRVLLADIEEERTSSLSMMPNGLAFLIEPDELADLVAFLETLTGDQ